MGTHLLDVREDVVPGSEVWVGAGVGVEKAVAAAVQVGMGVEVRGGGGVLFECWHESGEWITCSINR